MRPETPHIQGRAGNDRSGKVVMRRVALLTLIASLAAPAANGATPTQPVPADPSSATLWLKANRSPSPARITAEVTRAGKRRELTWWVVRRPGQRVTFEERGHAGTRVLGSTTGGTGSLRFKPNGARGVRRIVARVEVDGVERELLTVARFKVRGR